MTQRLIFHIGHPKTGTTTLQKTLQASRPALLDAGILHPDTGLHHNHKTLLPYLTHGALTTCTQNPTSLEQLKQSGNKWTGVVESVNRLNPKTVILSSEQFSRNLGEDAFKEIISKVKSLADEIVIAAYLREPASLAMSRAQQHIKSRPSFTLPPKRYYRDILEAYKACNLDSMVVRIFDRSKLKGGDIVQDFFSQHIPEFDSKQLIRHNDANTAFSAEAMALIQEVHRNERSLPDKKVNKAIEQADSKLQGQSRPRMHDHVRHAIQARCNDLDWLKDQFNLEFPSIETGVMPSREANQICDALDKVEDICAVDTDRKEALWRATCNAYSPIRRLFGRISKIG